MLIALGCVTLLAAALIGLIFYLLRSIREERAQWMLERRELNERIQRPERIPVIATAAPLEIPERDLEQERAYSLVGQPPVISDDYGLGDD